MIWFRGFLRNFSFQKKIFILNILLILGSSLTVIPITILQYRSQSKKYREQRAQRKARSVRVAVNYALYNGSTEGASFDQLIDSLQHIVNRQADIENVKISVFGLDRSHFITSKSNDSEDVFFSEEMIRRLKISTENYLLNQKELPNNSFQMTVYQTVFYRDLELVLVIGYSQSNTFYASELANFIWKLTVSYTFMLLVSFGVAYFFSRQITTPLIAIKRQLSKVGSNYEKISLKRKSKDEIGMLIDSYNEMQSALKKSMEALALHERSKAWKEMAKQIAHEVKNPLTPMRLSVQSLQRKLKDLPPSDRDLIDAFCTGMISQIDSLVSVSDAFSDFSSEMNLKKPLDLSPEVSRAIKVFDPEMIDLSLEQDIQILFSRSALTQILMNLIKNSLQAMPKGGVPNIKIATFRKGSKAFLRVSDNGKGMDSEMQNSIFEPNFTTKSAGTGLGLAIVKEALTMVGGTISVCSEPNGGADFLITFKIHNDLTT